jgi:hypothetical protein
MDKPPMEPREKIQRLAAIGRHVALINKRYGFNDDHKLTSTLEEVKEALRNRVIEILES